jgi:membrane fusion protein, multidrug efflux system
VSSRQYKFQPAGAVLAALLMVAAVGASSCKPKQNAPPQMPPPQVTVIKVTAAPVTTTDEYVGQAEAQDTVEIRARVGGILVRQAFKDGEHVKMGQTLYIIDQQPYIVALAQAKADLEQAKAAKLNAQQVLDRAKPLAEAQAVSEQDLDSAVAGERTASARVEAAKAAVEQAELNLEYATVKAPRDGYITSSLVRQGSLISQASTLMATLYSVDPIYITTTISEAKLLELTRAYGGNLGRDMKGGPSIKVVLVDGSQYNHEARINYFDPAVDKQTGTLDVRVSVPNPERLLRPGQFVRLIFPGRTIKDAIEVPLQAVQMMQEVKTVLVVGPDGTVEPRTITGDTRVGNSLVVESGLKPGDTVIVEGTAKASPGMKVVPVPEGEAGAAAGAAPQKKAAH